MDEYGRIARLYDPLVGRPLRPIHRAMAERLARTARTVLDLCCGTGLLAGQALERGLAVTGADLSPHMLAVARARRPGAEYILADASALPLPDDDFDGAAISFALHEKPLHTARAILAEARRVVRPGGPILIADYLPTGPGQSWLTGRAIRLVERLAGRGHHARFLEYMAGGGAVPLLAHAGLSARLERTFMDGWVGLYAAEATQAD
ncbi:Malonyl-[acyl-carrier protein] O-methyltransferase [Pseudodesulfovibrio hydrargyri]|uniref:Malonyl-[acyl-carrier protein] O-methyltransferase n=1 Tax=Pseudodesulfovibrio hydrargyri TaxID=2125990 RepID=A0A1J5MW37_9BACT|nr:class I SAM-dependent methyltransferase [Pseudodesulfovibrio hydrargyri]OIQ50186.1 Malonyl-[acyl-carrier protein] O-methyltransferase [Pseudodesulfovibrio hydrargyri]